jgi:sugar lactone lactonase YvrE
LPAPTRRSCRSQARSISLPESGAFDFANDVVFDTRGNLLIADMGEVTGARKPQDGAIWRYVLTTADLEVIPAKKKLSDPKLLARDAKGTIFFLDGEAGDLAAPPFDVRWDVLYEIGGAKQNKFRVTWSEPGLQGTAYAIDSSGWHWVVNLAELVRVKGGKIRNPCLPPYTIAFATGLAFSPGGDAHVSDGSDVVGRARRVAELDSECVATPVASARLNGIRGLAGVDSE